MGASTFDTSLEFFTKRYGQVSERAAPATPRVFLFWLSTEQGYPTRRVASYLTRSGPGRWHPMTKSMLNIASLISALQEFAGLLMPGALQGVLGKGAR